MSNEPQPAKDSTEAEEEAVEDSRDTGGDAPAAGTVAEREAVARGDDELFGGEEDEDRQGGG